MPARVFHWMQSALNAASDFLLPPQCAGCGVDLRDDGENNSTFCASCDSAFHATPRQRCPRCDAPVPAVSITPEGCPHCATTSFRFQRVVSLGVYEGKLAEFVLRMKHPGEEALTMAAGRCLASRINQSGWGPAPEIVLPIPMHWWRRMVRGVNATEILAEAVAAELHLPWANDAGRVVRTMPRQASLSPARRRRNMRGAFAISRAYDLRKAHVLVVDDVLTTAATANAFSQALLLAGAATVSIGVIARGIGRD